jgi:cytidylate kinase
VRAGRLASGGVRGLADAAREIRESDVSRADYLKRFYQVERELPEHYDLVISTDMLTPLQAAGIVAGAARTIGG